ncbi:HlyD family secretion protein [Caproiciproducens faecalis]|uniref:Efflux RND transporter periplasmic adaptor subunit n=1 Tax=Caproiciproducens faecalis TaxID=2820301 RepID=A0ABS7DM76_9FIRM|nr:efflux RND transporter periplasmic adaptor subunit [Caproiciproducens faecalis]MBW7572318.1 efflux RND transporter periplasmic adaptor subunit [Caproiciproducens faecalis]
MKTKLVKHKKLLITLLFVLVIGGCAGVFYYFSVSANTLKTDNARVTAKMYTVTGTSASRLMEWNVSKGDFVVKNEVLGSQETMPSITSPIDGTVVKCDAIAGQPASPTTPLAIIADTDDMYIGVNIEETEIAKVAVGQNVDVTIDAYGGKAFHGKVTEIDSATQTYFSNGLTSFSTSGDYTKVTQLIPIKVVIENPDEMPMLYGMNCEVKIHLH